MKRLLYLALCGVSMVSAGIKTKKGPPPPSPIDVYIAESAQHASAASQGSTGSIWTADARFSGLAMDLRANKVDDIVTILVDEKASAVSTGNTKTQRTSSVQAGITGLVGIPHVKGPLPNLAKANSDIQLNGQGTTSRTNALTTTLSARVTHVLPNGLLVVEGTKSVMVNSETQVVTVRGVVRPIDLDTGNTITSARLAQMEIKVNGKGVVGDAIRRPFFLYRLLLGLLPF